jgi:rfaE bifunctional protein nucleotidyltransferase chain/domain/rfaE bifunctional protein kinase chain/domain
MSELLVVVGDTLLDRDIDGTVGRICPDAPAPVLDERAATVRPGGAGLAALLAAGQGYDVALVTAIATDDGGAVLTELLTSAGVRLYPLPLPGATPEKIRLRSGGHVLLRLDRGGDTQPPGEPPPAALDLLPGAAAILVSDYGRGTARQPALRAALTGTAAPTVWDPHPRGPAPVRGVRLATPNTAEVRGLTGVAASLTGLTRGGHELRQRWRAGAVAVTRGAEGAVLCHAGPTPLVVPAPAVSGGDTCGAGDRFAAAATVALARGALVSEAVQDAVAQASGYVAAGGVSSLADEPVPERPGDAARLVSAVRARGGTVVATGGCFDLLHAGHIATLQAARALGDCLVVCLNSDASVRGLKGPDRPLTTQADRARVLSALGCVDAVVVFDEPTPEPVLSWLRPDIWVKGGDYADTGTDLPEAEAVRRWGGQTVIVPYVDGRSTSRTIAAARTTTGGNP